MLTLDPALSPLKRAFAATLEKTLSYLTHEIVAVSQAEQAHIGELGIAPDKLRLVPNGIALDALSDEVRTRSEAREALGIPENVFCIGFVGRLAPQKGLAGLISALAVLKREHVDARLVVVGDGPLRTELQELATSQGVADAITWCGERNPSGLLKAFDVFALPSVYESFPYVLLEAMLAGLPIVATAVGGVSTLVGDGYNGFLVRPSSSEALSAALCELARDRHLRANMALNSRERIKQFTLTKMVDDIESCYTSVNTSAVSQPVSSVSWS